VGVAAGVEQLHQRDVGHRVERLEVGDLGRLDEDARRAAAVAAAVQHVDEPRFQRQADRLEGAGVLGLRVDPDAAAPHAPDQRGDLGPALPGASAAALAGDTVRPECST